MTTKTKFNWSAGDKQLRSCSQGDLEFLDAFSDYASGRRRKAYESCLQVIRTYCEHVRDAVLANDELAETSVYDRPGKNHLGSSKAGELCKYCKKKNCTAIRAPIEMTRWHCLFSFVQFKMIEQSELCVTRKAVRNVIMSLKNATGIIDINRLGKLPEFHYLRQDCILKCVILYCDYLDLPWSAYSVLKKNPRTFVEEQQQKMFDEYENTINRKCMVWYILRR